MFAVFNCIGFGHSGRNIFLYKRSEVDMRGVGFAIGTGCVDNAI